MANYPNHKFLFLSMIILIVLSIIFFKAHSMNNQTTNGNEMTKWGVRASEVQFTARKNYVNNVGLETQYINSPHDKTKVTEIYGQNQVWLRTLDIGGGQWGYGTEIFGGDKVAQPLPEVLKLTYYSRLEDSFYHLEAKLPKDKIESIFHSKLLNMFYNSKKNGNNKYQQYDNFEIAIGPKGWITLFLTSTHGNRKIIQSWQANEIKADYEYDILSRNDNNIEWLKSENFRKKNYEEMLTKIKNNAPAIYKDLKDKKATPDAEWLKKMQIKYPWRLEVIGKGSEWTGEYYTEFANTERYEVLQSDTKSDQFLAKSIPTKIGFWVIVKASKRKFYVEIHLLPIPKWLVDTYIPYDREPNLTYFAKRFEHFYPKHSLATNNQPAKPEDFATLKIHLNEDGKMDSIYLQKGNEKLPIDGAYEYYLAEVDPEQGGYIPYVDGFDYFVTKPKIKDLSDPLFVDLD